MLQRLLLPTDWTLALLDGHGHGHAPADLAGVEVPATVPGCVHTDLMAAGRLADPYVGRNEEDQRWIKECGWRYACELEVDAETLVEDRVELACDGLDTFATVRVNGEEVGRSENMHLRHRFDAKAALRPGSNRIEIDFEPALHRARELEQRFPGHASSGYGANPALPFQHVRKMSCSFGWDWGPQTVSAGVWRPIALEAWSGTRIADLRPAVVRAESEVAVVELAVDLDGAATGGVTAVLRGPDGAEAWSGDVDPAGTTIRLGDPERWWPVGHGGQPLYELEVTASDAAGRPLHAVTRKIGLRVARLVTDSDVAASTVLERMSPDLGETFHLEVNGRRVFAKGANWIPDDCFPHRVTRERVRERLGQAVDANMNCIRVWGGGTYESEDFYGACDEMGLLVWQDFLMACATYPEEGPMPAWLEAEARDNVARLASHPSLVLWCGCNENFWAVEDWPQNGWPEILPGGEPWGAGYYLGLFPEVVADLDPHRAYWPGSPWSGGPASGLDGARRANGNGSGDIHCWDGWFVGGGRRHYLKDAPRFASEFGYHGPPTWPTLTQAVPEGERTWDSATMVAHNKQEDGQGCGREQSAVDFEWPAGDDAAAFDAQLFVTTLMQCRTLELGCTWFRVLSPWCSGAVYWQLNDCWPVTSWSAVDGDGRLKPLWHATRAFFAPRLLALMPAHVVRPGEPITAINASLHNDHADPFAGTLRVERWRVDGREPEDRFEADLSADPRACVATRVPEGVFSVDPGHVLVATARNGDAGGDALPPAFWFGGPDRDVVMPDPGLTFDLAREGRRHRLTVTAERFCRELCLFPDRLDPAAAVDLQRVTLRPGDAVTFAFDADRELALEELTAAPVLDHAGRHGKRG